MQGYCNKCGNKTARGGYKYCSNQCQLDYQYAKYINDWLNGEIDGGTSSGLVSSHIKRYLREKYNNACQDCGWSKINQYTNKVPLEVEHVDGNHTNNKIDNLKIICPNCHSLTGTYKALNKGNGRSWRMLP
jgi:hypothetical protein